jgi:hypothetical protein
MCMNGMCVDGFCCESACQGPCQACTNNKTMQANGSCRPIVMGTDPDNECNPEPANPCGRTGECNGAGACAVRPAATPCGPTACMGSTFNPGPACNGMGTCETRPARACAFNLLCASATTCKTGCMDDADCVMGNYCDPADMRCKPKRAFGLACDPARANECASGNCVDGVCCDTACGGACMACTSAKTGHPTGRCNPVAAGMDPDNECAMEAVSTCGKDGFCDGNGACRMYADGTTCGGECCSRPGGPGTRPCKYVCQGGACATGNPIPTADGCPGAGSCCCPGAGPNGSAACTSALTCGVAMCM